MRSRRYFLPLVVAALVAGACDNGDSISGDGRGRLTIGLTDAPAADIKEAWIQIDEFILFNDSTSGSITLDPTQTGWINLLALSGGKVLDIVNKALVPNGSYSQLRLVLGDAYIVLKDGRVFATPGADLPSGVTAVGEAKCPSCAQSGYKVNFTNGPLIVNSNTFVLIDFDVAQSFAHEAGKSGKVIIHPVLKATTQNVAFSLIKGLVSLAQNITIPACGGQNNTRAIFKPTAATVTDTVTAAVDTAGNYRITNLAPATYTMSAIKDYTFANGDSLTIASTPTPGSVTLAAGDSATVNYQITAATCH